MNRLGVRSPRSLAAFAVVAGGLGAMARAAVTGTMRVTGPVGLASAMALALCLLGGQALHAAICTLIRRRRRLAVAARHVDPRGLRIGDRPPRRLTEWPGLRMLAYEVSALSGLGATPVTGDARWVVAGLTAAAGGVW